MDKLLHKELTDEIIGAFYNVYNELGYGFLEKVYQNALYYELLKRGLNVVPKPKVKVFYKEKVVGIYEPCLQTKRKSCVSYYSTQLLQIKATKTMTKKICENL